MTVLSLRQVVAVAAATSLATMALVAGTAWLLLPGWRAHIQLDAQQMQVRLPEGMPVTVDIVEPVETDLETEIDVAFPIDETLPVHFEGPLRMNVTIDTHVPMRTVIKYESVLPLDAEVTASVFGLPVKVPVHGNIPVRLFVPIDQKVPLKFDAPVTINMTEELQVPVKMDFKARIPLEQRITMPIQKPLETNIQMSDRPVAVEMSGSDLVLPLDKLWLERNGDEARAGE